jgi:hypothetical protein
MRCLVVLSAAFALGGCDFLFQLNHLSATDAPADVGSVQDAPVDVPPGARLVFVTSQPFDAQFNGLSGADLKCASAAQSASRSGTFVAWVSTSSMGVAARISKTGGPFVLTNGVVVADSWADLTDGLLAHAIDRSENNVQVASMAGCDVWTHTTISGQPMSTDSNTDCSDWTDQGNSTRSVGDLAAMGPEWTASPTCNVSCAALLHLYCIQQ